MIGRIIKVIQSLPTICPGRNSRLILANVRNTKLSTIRPTTLEPKTANVKFFFCSGAYTIKSNNSLNRNALPLASAKNGLIYMDRIAPITIATTAHLRPKERCTKSLNVNPNPIANTPLGA
jgi:hypothetical protein